MNKFLMTVCFLFIVSFTVSAQEPAKVEFFSGYSATIGSSPGWNASVARNLNRWLSLVGDVSSHQTNLNEDGEREKISARTLIFGPQFSLRRRKLTPFTRLLLGAIRIKAESTGSGRTSVFTDTTFGYGVGGGLDISVNDRLAIRAIQVDYLRTHAFNETQHIGRLSFGLVIRLGRR